MVQVRLWCGHTIRKCDRKYLHKVLHFPQIRTCQCFVLQYNNLILLKKKKIFGQFKAEVLKYWSKHT
jgi:hypothetical protein